ncbi:MAG: ABC transporter substrate-binding protein [Burkholderiales bacterium]|nr:ABC transporter substrate-binding protein [Burkholderiales bacterium]
MNTRRRFIAAGTTLAAGAVFPGTLSAQTGRPETASLSMGFGIDPPFAPHIVAMQKGWFREAGFSDVKTRTFQSGNLAGEALVAGEIQLWTPGNLPPISMVHNGIPVVVVGTASVNWDVEKLTVRKDANVSTPEDLYKIKIGLFQGSTSSAFLSTLAKHYGLDEKRLQVVNLPPPEQLASLTSNNVQALLCWEPWPNRALATGIANVVHSGLTSYFSANNGQRVKVSDGRSVLVVSQEFARRSPNALRAAVGALLRAQRYVANPANLDEVQRMFAEFQKQDLALVRAIWGNYVFNPGFDDAYVADMERTAAFLEASGRIKKRMNVLDYTFTDPLAGLDASLVRVGGRWKA